MSDFRNNLLKELQRDYTYDNLAALAKTYGTPLLVVDAQKIAKQHAKIQSAMPRVTPHFAVKSCPMIEVLRIYKSLGAHLDIATPGEIELLKQLSYDPKLLIYTHPHPKPKDIQTAYDYGIRSFVFDSETELHKFEAFKNDIELSVRLSFPNDSVAINLSYKFGATPDEAFSIVKRAISEGFNVSGLCFHVGSQVEKPDIYKEALEKTHTFAKRVKEELGHTFSSLDIGGGFPSPYTHPVPAIEEIGNVVNPVLEECFEGYTVQSEPGRFLVNSCVFLLSSVVSTSRRGGESWLFIDDGVYGSFTDMISGHSVYMLYGLKELAGTAANAHYVVAGPTCDSIDVINTSAQLPELEENDIILSPNMGAYSWALLTEFNSIAKPRVVVINDKSAPKS